MAVELTPEQLHLLDTPGKKLHLIDPRTGKRYIVVPSTDYDLYRQEIDNLERLVRELGPLKAAKEEPPL